MEQINNDQTIRECSKVLGHPVENIPQLDTSKIILTSEVNPKLIRRIEFIIGGGQSSTGSFNIYTTPTTKDFYLTDISASLIKDVVCDSATGAIYVSVVIGGVVSKIINFSIISLTAQDKTISLHFDAPIKLDRGTNVAFIGTFTAGVMRRDISLMGYFVENQSSI